MLNLIRAEELIQLKILIASKFRGRYTDILRPQMRGQSFILKQVERKKWEEFLIIRRFLVENLPFFEEMEEFIGNGKSFLSRGGRVFHSLSVYLPLSKLKKKSFFGRKIKF